ncbi:MAG: transposase [Kiritimatiellales bacterium]|nr:transposase [Kiritimatiellales bacterium]
MGREFKKSMSQKLRMEGGDYSRPGWYFLTLGADYHRHFFGRIEGCEMQPNDLGRLVEQCWREIPQHYDHIELGAWQVMPNHFHGLIRLVRPGGKGLGEVVNMFKGSVTREWRRAQGAYEGFRHGGKEQGHGGKEQGHGGKEQDGKSCRSENVRVWAPNYYDVICFDADELAVRENYVRANPRRWALRGVPKGHFKNGFYKGNLSLLKTDALRKVLRVSRRASEFDIEKLQQELATLKGVVFSTFFSPGERACLKTILSGTAGAVWVAPIALPERIPGEWADAFLEERALWISLNDIPDASRESCEEANRMVEELAGER